MKILVLGSSSFAAQGLTELLKARGHDVWTFDRGAGETSGGRFLSGDYSQLTEIVEPMDGCDALINFAIVKFGSIEDNRILLGHIVKAAEALGVRRFIQVSSISVLPSDRAAVNEATPVTTNPWKGSYSRIKVDAEAFLSKRWRSSPLLVVRPGFILGQGLVDPTVGIGMRLPTSQLLGLGNERTIIPLVSREAVHEAIARIVILSLEDLALRHFMLVSPTAPTRKDYLEFHCRQFGRGTHSVHLAPWIWKWGLAVASLPLSLLQGRRFRLARLFDHNIAVRQYDCSATRAALGINLDFDWQQYLCDSSSGRDLVDTRVTNVQGVPLPQAERLLYVGFGRIVEQKHLPALRRVGYRGTLVAVDSVVTTLPASPGLSVNLVRQIPSDCTHAVITAPWFARREILEKLPKELSYVLLEKPFAVSSHHLVEMQKAVAGRNVWLLHNYRRKSNVAALRRFMKEHPPGELRHVSLRFETPTPFIEKSAWMRREKQNRILITDYGMHFLDLTWLFFEGAMEIRRLKVTDNSRGELESLSAELSFANGNCSLLIRQGCHRRECHVHYCFQNYDAHLRFFPDVFVTTFGGHSAWDDLRFAAGLTKSTANKIGEKLGVAVSDRSHEEILAAFVGLPGGCTLEEFSLPNLLPFYQRLTQLADAAYG